METVLIDTKNPKVRRDTHDWYQNWTAELRE